jgi:hypothetical protein
MNKLMLGALIAALHITPVVVLVKRADAVRRILPEATQFSAREFHLSRPDAKRLTQAVDWKPENDVLTFYTAAAANGDSAVGALTFVRVDSPHGPVEVAVGFTKDGSVRRVEVTKATVETKPWILEALGAGLLAYYTGLPDSAQPDGAAALKQKVGAMPEYLAGVIDQGVARALAAYRLFYRPSAA